MHELSHAYHCHNAAEIDQCIKSAYEQAMASGKYDSSEIMGSNQAGVKPYGAGNHMEFFAESSEAFFSSKRFRNDYFPYIHDELKGFDPVAYRMCEQAWGVSGDSMLSRGEIPQQWLHQLAKVSEADARHRFAESDKDGSGTLNIAEISAVVSSMCRGLGHEEVQSMLTYIDANKDGVVSYDEFVTWLASVDGAFI